MSQNPVPSSPRISETGYETPGHTATATTRRSEEPARDAGTTDRVEVRKAANGGFIATCYKRPSNQKSDEYIAPKDYAFADLAAAVGFLESEFGGGAAAETAAPGRSAPAAAPSPMPARPMNGSVYLPR